MAKDSSKDLEAQSVRCPLQHARQIYHNHRDGQKDPITVTSISVFSTFRRATETHNNAGSRWIVCTTGCAILFKAESAICSSLTQNYDGL